MGKTHRILALGGSEQRVAKRKVDLDTRFLCEGCGYDLTGVEPERACSECGKVMAESAAAHRTGTAWQNHGGMRGWWGSLIELVRGNKRMWAVARVEVTSGVILTTVNALLTGAVFWIALMIEVHVFDREEFPRFDRWLLVGLLIVLMVGGVTLVLTGIEQRGICFFGNRRGWRISEGVGWTVVGHASYGWLVSGVLCGALMLEPVQDLLPWFWMGVPVLVWYVEGSFLALIGAGFVGMLVFEVCVYLGVRRMRYANPGAVVK